MVNLANATATHKTLCELLAAAGEDMNSMEPGYSSKSSEGVSKGNAGPNSGGIIFNHDQCHDCSYVQLITNDCINHLNLLTKQTVDASQRLLQLVELRERVSGFSADSHSSSVCCSCPCRCETAQSCFRSKN